MAGKEKFSKLKSAGLGALQGVSLGFADEIEGGAKALKEVMGPDKNLSDIVNLYKQRRDESRSMYDEAQKENPKSFLAGSAAGALGTALIPGASALTATTGLRAAGIGAGAGGLAGLGSSTAEDLKGLAKDVVEGSIVGGAAGPLAQKGFSKIKGLLTPEVPAAIPKMSQEAARKAQKEMQMAMEEIGEKLARTPAKPSPLGKTPEETKALLSKIQETEVNLPELIKQAQMRRNKELAEQAQRIREIQPAEESTVISDLNGLLAHGQ